MPQGSLFDESDEKRARKTRAPDEFNPAQMRRLEDWVESTVPWISRGTLDADQTLDGYLEEFLDFWHGEGRLKADWVRTAQTWIRRAERRRLQRMMNRGNEKAKLALRDPEKWARDFDRVVAMKPLASGDDSGLIRPMGGNVIHLRRN